MIFIAIIVSIVFPYLIGSIPTGFIVVKLKKGIDIREAGSGNIGATNVKRVLGMKWFIIVLVLDVLKGYIPVMALNIIFGAQYPVVPVLAAAAAVLGHTFTIFLKFKGGKGVATSLGVFLALAPLSMLVDALLFFIIVWFFRYISLGSILCAFLLPIFIFINGEQGYLALVLILSIPTAAFVIYKHKDNIKRLLNGTESKFEISSKPQVKEKGAKK